MSPLLSSGKNPSGKPSIRGNPLLRGKPLTPLSQTQNNYKTIRTFFACFQLWILVSSPINRCNRPWRTPALSIRVGTAAMHKYWRLDWLKFTKLHTLFQTTCGPTCECIPNTNQQVIVHIRPSNTNQQLVLHHSHIQAPTVTNHCFDTLCYIHIGA